MTDPYNSSPMTARTPLLDRTMVTTALELPDYAGSLRIWPVTRPGRDGPIAVSYRVLPER